MPATAPEQRAAAPAARFAAAISDMRWLAMLSVGAFVIALGFLFWRSSWGAVDADSSDTAIAAALLLAPGPAWLARLLLCAIADHATPGQQRRQLVVGLAANARAGARLFRFALHPFSAAGWFWLATIAFLLDALWLTGLFLLAGVMVALFAVGSAILIILGRRALHDLLARTRVEVRP